MPESRQRRRARQRAARKAATRPGPRPQPQPAPVEVLPPREPAPVEVMPPREYDVDVTRTEPAPNGPDDVPGWIAEGGLSEESSGVPYHWTVPRVAFDWTEHLAELVSDVAEDVARWRRRYPDLPIVWRLDDDEQAMADAAAWEGVELPR
jgi:hypothetical protein